MYVCVCKAVTERRIRQEVLNGATDYDQVQERLEVGVCCGQCQDATREVIDEVLTGHHEENVINMWQPRKHHRSKPHLKVYG